ncbi:hypothetical protein LTR10_019729 [Elasticomyces elasticus]|uniref:Uncharacterized protein n=1 Tax=Exophiala sideris TaxID=1016849 RepID=A0ABR0JKK8_9EURO|nr:hypothetical protein LTR10_019729 [Elasticomyces elasticus]KAK5032149.1 hypothetical protein LTR13_007366 [Exophiala sideris]KAK5036147.1 hypothetical protein LTS07_001872 [Exophiala sideris]KAK5066530.1 hypothetical protein LTR69_001876 [Exophiala sideris]KAK5180352.1 hypothetical protein LTR44_007109 [Eurotiomycetes sp. CCFEE 6388]
MQIAAFLSDLKSLSVCSYDAAIALVKPFNNTSITSGELSSTNGKVPSASQSSSSTTADLDPDLQRANELVSLHYDVKVKYLQEGPDPELLQARKDVEGVVYALDRAT